MFAADNRESLRAVFFRAWQRHQQGQPLEGVERLVVDVALRHPEYHAVLDNPAAYSDRDYPYELGQTAVQGRTNAARGRTPGAANPFLHMAMHISIEEQLALDQPAGVRAHYQRLLQRLPDEHAVQHQMMECLGEMLWQAARSASAPQESVYLDCLARFA